MIIGEPVTISFNVLGEVSGQSWAGDFSVKPILSFAAIAAVDAERRRFMGNPSDETAVPEEIRSIAAMISQIKYRVAKGPSWLAESNYLADMVDGNVLVELFSKVIGVENEYRDKLNKKAEVALTEMKTTA